MHWILKVTKLEENFVMLSGDAGEFVMPRSESPRDLRVGDTVRLEHGVRQGRARLGWQRLVALP